MIERGTNRFQNAVNRFEIGFEDFEECDFEIDQNVWMFQFNLQLVSSLVCATAYLKNRVLANTIEKKTPYVIFLQKKLTVEHLKLYGSRIFV